MKIFSSKIVGYALALALTTGFAALSSAAGVILSSPSVPTPSGPFAGGVDLKTAGPGYYTILALGGQGSSSDGVNQTVVTFNNGTIIQGNVGVASVGDVSMSGDAFINGTLYLNSGGKMSHSGTSGANTVAQGATVDSKLNQAVQDALNASSLAASQASTQPSITSISLGDHGTQTISGSGQIVLNLTTFDLGNQAALTLNAPAGSTFILNISGTFKTQGTVQLAGGISTSDVLYNVTGTGQAIAFSGGGNQAQLNGILLSPFRDIQLSPGLVNGEIIGGGKIVTLTSSADAVGVPEHSVTTLMLFGGLLTTGMTLWRSRRRQS